MNKNNLVYNKYIDLIDHIFINYNDKMCNNFDLTTIYNKYTLGNSREIEFFDLLFLDLEYLSINPLIILINMVWVI